MNFVSKEKKDEWNISPLVRNISGVIDLPTDYDYRIDYIFYLIKKYE